MEHNGAYEYMVQGLPQPAINPVLVGVLNVGPIELWGLTHLGLQSASACVVRPPSVEQTRASNLDYSRPKAPNPEH